MKTGQQQCFFCVGVFKMQTYRVMSAVVTKQLNNLQSSCYLIKDEDSRDAQCCIRIARNNLVSFESAKSFDMSVQDINEVDCHPQTACRG